MASYFNNNLLFNNSGNIFVSQSIRAHLRKSVAHILPNLHEFLYISGNLGLQPIFLSISVTYSHRPAQANTLPIKASVYLVAIMRQ